MKQKKRISKTLFEQLQYIYEHFYYRPPGSYTYNVSMVNFNLKEFLMTHGTEIILHPREVLFWEGDPVIDIYWMETGVIAVLEGDIEKPRSITYRHTTEKTHKWESSVFFAKNIQRTSSVVAISKTHLRYLSKEKFEELLLLSPHFNTEQIHPFITRLREIKPASWGGGLYDNLTCALSHRAFEFRLPEIIASAQQHNHSFSLILLDLDNLRDVNNAYGHARTDDVIAEFTKRVMDNLCSTALLFRIGGDEFVLILQDVDEMRVSMWVKFLLGEITTTPFFGQPPVTLSFSAGISYFPADGDTFEKLLDLADKRLYKAKCDGRGRVVDK